ESGAGNEHADGAKTHTPNPNRPGVTTTHRRGGGNGLGGTGADRSDNRRTPRRGTRDQVVGCRPRTRDDPGQRDRQRRGHLRATEDDERGPHRATSAICNGTSEAAPGRAGRTAPKPRRRLV